MNSYESIKITTSGPDRLNLKVTLSSKVHHSVKTENDNSLFISGNAPSKVQPNYVVCDNPIVYDEKKPGMTFCCYLHAINMEGTVTTDLDQLTIQDAKEVVFYLTAVDGYKKYNQKLVTDPKECENDCRKVISILSSRKIKEVFANYLEAYDQSDIVFFVIPFQHRYDHSHTMTLYPKGCNVDSIEEIIEVQNVEFNIGNRIATENDFALRRPLAMLLG